MNQRFVTLLDAIEFHAKEKPKANALTFYEDPPCTFENLQRGILQVASLLLDSGITPQDRVIIAIPNSVEFFFAFFGVIKAGGVAVPISPGSRIKRIVNFTQICDAAFILSSERYPNDSALLSKKELKRQNVNGDVKVLTVEKSFGGSPGENFPPAQPNHVAYLQFTSGSTGDPKGVQITHEGLMINMSQMIQGMQITDDDVFVSWLPVFHDMGLIMMSMVPLLLGKQFFLLPIGFKYLKTWLETIESHKATFTAAPDFMYRLTLMYIADPENYDLSTLRVALNAAEPIRGTTIDAFESAFNIKNVLLPAYGLAEATVGVSCWSPGKPIRIDHKGRVSVGKPFSQIEIKIDCEELSKDDRSIGEIMVKSPANTIGYFNNSESDKQLFTPDNYIKTGDVGYLDQNGDLTVVGRLKNIIIQGGVNVSSREVEELVDSFSFVRRSAAVGIDSGKTEGEQVHIFIETKLIESQNLEADLKEGLMIDVIQAFHDYFSFKPGRVILLPPRAIPITQNGKTQYSVLVEQYLSGELDF